MPLLHRAGRHLHEVKYLFLEQHFNSLHIGYRYEIWPFNKGAEHDIAFMRRRRLRRRFLPDKRHGEPDQGFSTASRHGFVGGWLPPPIEAHGSPPLKDERTTDMTRHCRLR